MVVSYSFLWKRGASERGDFWQEGQTCSNRPSSGALSDLASLFTWSRSHTLGRRKATKQRLPFPKSSSSGSFDPDEEQSWIDISTNITLSFGPARTSDPRMLRAARRRRANKLAFTASLPRKFFAKIRLALNEYWLSNKPPSDTSLIMPTAAPSARSILSVASLRVEPTQRRENAQVLCFFLIPQRRGSLAGR